MRQARRRRRRAFGRIRQFNSGRWQASYLGPDCNLYIAPEKFGLEEDAEACWPTGAARSTVECGRR